jgi:hypothetical protein
MSLYKKTTAHKNQACQIITVRQGHNFGFLFRVITVWARVSGLGFRFVNRDLWFRAFSRFGV